MNGINRKDIFNFNLINELKDENKRLNERVSELEIQLKKTKEEIKVLQKHFFGFEDKAYADTLNLGRNKLYLQNLYVFYKLSVEELSCFEANNKSNVKRISNPIEDFQITTTNNEIILQKYVGKDKTVIIPDNITSIGIKAFENCRSITSIVIPNKVERIDNYAFISLMNLKNIEIPDGVKRIGEGAFLNCSSIESIVFPDSVISIDDYACRFCANIKSVILPNDIKEIGSSVFGGCSSLASITIPDSVKSIGNYAFEHCTSLEKIFIPESVVSIGNYAFANCKKLKIFCKKGTKAHTYAIENHIAYKLIDK